MTKDTIELQDKIHAAVKAGGGTVFIDRPMVIDETIEMANGKDYVEAVEVITKDAAGRFSGILWAGGPFPVFSLAASKRCAFVDVRILTHKDNVTGWVCSAGYGESPRSSSHNVWGGCRFQTNGANGLGWQFYGHDGADLCQCRLELCEFQNSRGIGAGGTRQGTGIELVGSNLLGPFVVDQFSAVGAEYGIDGRRGGDSVTYRDCGGSWLGTMFAMRGGTRDLIMGGRAEHLRTVARFGGDDADGKAQVTPACLLDYTANEVEYAVIDARKAGSVDVARCWFTGTAAAKMFRAENANLTEALRLNSQSVFYNRKAVMGQLVQPNKQVAI